MYFTPSVPGSKFLLRSLANSRSCLIWIWKDFLFKAKSNMTESRQDSKRVHGWALNKRFLWLSLYIINVQSNKLRGRQLISSACQIWWKYRRDRASTQDLALKLEQEFEHFSCLVESCSSLIWLYYKRHISDNMVVHQCICRNCNQKNDQANVTTCIEYIEYWDWLFSLN